MAKKTEDVGAEFLLDLISTIDDNERAALDAIRRFVESVDKAVPRSDRSTGPRRQVEVVEAALNMIEQLLGVSNDVAQRLTESVREALPEIERNAKAVAKKRTAKKSTAKKAAAKKSTAKKSTARKSTAKKAAAKRPAAKKATARKTPAKKRAAARKSPAKKAAARV